MLGLCGTLSQAVFVYLSGGGNVHWAYVFKDSPPTKYLWHARRPGGVGLLVNQGHSIILPFKDSGKNTSA